MKSLQKHRDYIECTEAKHMEYIKEQQAFPELYSLVSILFNVETGAWIQSNTISPHKHCHIQSQKQIAHTKLELLVSRIITFAIVSEMTWGYINIRVKFISIWARAKKTTRTRGSVCKLYCRHKTIPCQVRTHRYSLQFLHVPFKYIDSKAGNTSSIRTCKFAMNF